ncbi:MAG: DUF4363 family protein [Ruminococcus sp.]|nr:DUF4363 family protein [Ruminococcus sp.]
MTRIKISIGILALLIGLSIFFGIWINNKCDDMLDEISTVFTLLNNSETEKALSASDNLNSHWKSFRKKAAVMLKNNELTEIDCISSGIPYLIENGSDEVHSRLMEFQHMLEMLKSSESPTITRIL